MLDAHNFPNKPNGVGVSYARTSEYTRRDFMFAPISVTGGVVSYASTKKYPLTNLPKMMIVFLTASTTHEISESLSCTYGEFKFNRLQPGSRNTNLGDRFLGHK